jgi:hypothetical protein
VDHGLDAGRLCLAAQIGRQDGAVFALDADVPTEMEGALDQFVSPAPGGRCHRR